jgi:hypothetical protein
LAAQRAPAPGELQFPTYALAPPVVALGGAGAAWSHDAAASANPALLFSAARVSVYHYEGFADYGGDLAAASVRVWGRLALGVSVRRFGWDRVIEDDVGVPTEDLKTGDAQYALTMAVSPTASLQLGATAARLISENLGVRTSAASWSLGAVMAYARSGGVCFALVHAGPAARGTGAIEYPLPTRLRAGIAQRLGAFTLLADVEWPPHETRAWTAHAGVEWRAPAVLVPRTGLQSLASPGAVERDMRLAGGLGLVIGPLEVSLTTRFGGVAGSQEWFVGLDALRPRRH